MQTHPSQHNKKLTHANASVTTYYLVYTSTCEFKYITTKQYQYYENKNFNKHHINTTTQEHQILCGKPSGVKGKITGQLRKISTIK